MSEDVRSLYQDSLGALTDTASPVIANLTELAYEYADDGGHERVIATLIQDSLKKAPPALKLPYLYLVDSICKKRSEPYRSLFKPAIVGLFTQAFVAVGQNLRSNDDVTNATKTRAKMYKVRITWAEIFPAGVLHELDVQIQKFDPRWPLASKPAAVPAQAKPIVKAVPGVGNIHMNPAYFARNQAANVKLPPENDPPKSFRIPKKTQKRSSSPPTAPNQRDSSKPAASGNDASQPTTKKAKRSKLNEELFDKPPSPNKSLEKSEPGKRKAKEAAEAAPSSKKGAEPPAPIIRKSPIPKKGGAKGGPARKSGEPAASERPSSSSPAAKKGAKGVKGALSRGKSPFNESRKSAEPPAPIIRNKKPSPKKGGNKGAKNSNSSPFKPKAAEKRGKAGAPAPGGANGKDPRGGAPQMPPEFEGFQNADPHEVEKTVIPQIVKTAQQGLMSGSMSVEQFTELMHQVAILKEQTMMKRAFMNQRQQQQQQQPGRFAMPPPTRTMPPPPPSMMPPPPFSGPPPPLRFQQQQQQQRGGACNSGSSSHLTDLPLADPQLLEEMSHDPVKSIHIDGVPREIRFYNETATCALADNEVRELIFKPSGAGGAAHRRAVLDGNPNVVPPLALHSTEYAEFAFDGQAHRIKIGAPTRELWVDGTWYECYFGREIRVALGANQFHTLYLEGPPPNVDIGAVRSDLCAGYVQVIIDGRIHDSTRLYLDSKPQLFHIGGKPHVLQLCQGLKTLLINGQPFDAVFGDIPMVIPVNGQAYYLRLTSLPHGVRVGRVKLWGMDGNMDMKASSAAAAGGPGSAGAGASAGGTGRASRSCSPSSTTHPPHDRELPTSTTTAFDSETDTRAFDTILKLLPAAQGGAGAARDADLSSESSYKCNDDNGGAAEARATSPTTTSKSPSSAPVPGTPGTPVNMNNLWSQLVSAGLVSSGAGGAGAGEGVIPGLETPKRPAAGKTDSSAKDEDEAGVKEEPGTSKGAGEGDEESDATSTSAKQKKPEISPIELKSHDPSLKVRQQSIVSMLYDTTAFMCKNCGQRFNASKMNTAGAYMKHLDWHYRMNRREKERKLKGKTQSRLWYLKQDEWIESEEIEDEDKDPMDEDDPAAAANAGSKGVSPVGDDIPVVLVEPDAGDDDATCPICGEEFSQDYREASDDATAADADASLHYLHAIRAPEDGRVYHPQCHADLRKQGTRTALFREAVAEEEDGPAEAAVKEEQAEEKEEEEAMDTEPATGDQDMPDAEAVKEEADGEPAQDDQEPVEPKEEPMDLLEEGEDKHTEEPPVDIKQEELDEKPAEGADEAGQTEQENKDAPEEEASEEANDSVVALEGLDDAPMAAPPQSFLKADIKVNIPSNLERPSLERRESVVSSQSESEDAASSEFDVDAIKQMMPPEELDARHALEKPQLEGKTFEEKPPVRKSSELSGLCSIM